MNVFEALRKQQEQDQKFKLIAEYIKIQHVDHLVIRDNEFVDFFRNGELILTARKSKSKSSILTTQTICNPEWTLAINDSLTKHYKYHTLFLLNKVNAPSRILDKYYKNQNEFRQILNSVNIEEIESYDDDYDDYDDYSYDKYNGAYGFDDDTIDSAFEGDPEAYWNID